MSSADSSIDHNRSDTRPETPGGRVQLLPGPPASQAGRFLTLTPTHKQTSWPPGRSGWWVLWLERLWRLQVLVSHWSDWPPRRPSWAAAGWAAGKQPTGQEGTLSLRFYTLVFIVSKSKTFLLFNRIPIFKISPSSQSRSVHRPWGLCLQRWWGCHASAPGSASRSQTYWCFSSGTHTGLPRQRSEGRTESVWLQSSIRHTAEGLTMMALGGLVPLMSTKMSSYLSKLIPLL